MGTLGIDWANKKSNPIFHIFSVDPVMRVHITVEPRFTDTHLIRNIANNDSFPLSLVEIKKPLHFLLILVT